MTDDCKLRGLKEHNERLSKVISESLQQALLLLMEKKEYQKISITELCQRAGVSRMAFYSNFETKDKLLEAVVIEMNKMLIKKIGSPFRDYVNVDWYITLLKTTKEFSNTLLLVFRAGFKYKYISIINGIVLHNPYISDKQRYARLMWSGGMTNVIIDWLENNMRVSVEELAEYCFNLFKYLF